MKKWLLTCSVDGVNIDYEATLDAPTEPSFWTCQEIAEDHGCTLWALEQIRE